MRLQKGAGIFYADVLPFQRLCQRPQRMRPSLLFSVSFLSSCFFLYLLGSFEVTVTSVSLPPFVSRRGLSNTNQRLSSSSARLMQSSCHEPIHTSRRSRRRRRRNKSGTESVLETERLLDSNPDRARQTSCYPGRSLMRGASGTRVPKASLYAVSLMQIHLEPHTFTNAHLMISHSSSHDK